VYQHGWGVARDYGVPSSGTAWPWGENIRNQIHLLRCFVRLERSEDTQQDESDSESNGLAELTDCHRPYYGRGVLI